MTIRDPEMTAVMRRDVLAGRRRHTNRRPSLEGHEHDVGDIAGLIDALEAADLCRSLGGAFGFGPVNDGDDQEINVSFPGGYFRRPPEVVMVPHWAGTGFTTSVHARYGTRTTPTTSGFVAYVRAWDGDITGTRTMRWVASERLA